MTLPLRRNSKKRKLQKTARKAAKAAPPTRSLALIAAALIGLVAAVIAKRFLGRGDTTPAPPIVESHGTTWAPQPVPQEVEEQAKGA
jgi:hypothetical protein